MDKIKTKTIVFFLRHIFLAVGGTAREIIKLLTNSISVIIMTEVVTLKVRVLVFCVLSYL